MASSLIGISVIVTLRNPPNTVVHGLVAAVNTETSTLTLRNVFFPASGHRLDDYSVEGTAIADIKVDSPVPAALPPQTAHQAHVHHASPVSVPVVAPAPLPFEDPAILSVGKRQTAHATSRPIPTTLQEAPASSIKPTSAHGVPLTITKPPLAVHHRGGGPRKPSAATLEKPFSGLYVDDESNAPGVADALRASVNRTRTGKLMSDIPKASADDTAKRVRRGGKGRKKDRQAAGTDNGWRQTPLLHEPVTPAKKTPGVIAGRIGLEAASASARKSKRQRALEATNGWATEDATDIQDLPEFDFAGNLSKFDKRTVFEAIRNEDTTADEDRLVSFNRLPRPGTHGGKNLHPTENVLGLQRLRSVSNSDSEGELTDVESAHTRTSLRALSHASTTKRAPTRQGSGLNVELESPHHTSTAPSLVSRVTRSMTGLDPILDSKASFLQLLHNNRRCPTISPATMAAVEETAEVEFGLSEEIIAENAGRGIAEVVLSALNPGGRRLARENHNARPVVVVLAGNHRGGARAVAAARQLQGRGPKVLVALLGFEREADWDKDVRRQTDLFRALGGSVRSWPSLQDALKRLQAPPELIIDALLGRNKEFDALGDEDRRTVLDVVGWANKSRASVLAVETPSGVGGLTGEVAILEGEPLEVRAKHIVCLGAPRTGLLKALQNGSGRDPVWSIWVVDIGINTPWKSSGVKGGGVKFGENWVMQVGHVVGEEVVAA